MRKTSYLSRFSCAVLCLFISATYSLARENDHSSGTRPGASAAGSERNMRDAKTDKLSTPLQSLAMAAIKDKQYYFVENVGQIKDQNYTQRNDIDFALSGSKDLQVFVGNGAIHYQFSKPLSSKESANTYSMYRMDVELLGANGNAHYTVSRPLQHLEWYYTPNTGKASARTFDKITYENVYPHIDWVLYASTGGKLKHEFHIHKGGKISDIKVKYKGANTLKINDAGAAVATTPQGNVTEAAPYTYQAGGKKIASRFKIEGDVLSYETDSYEGELIIDPTIDWATYYGDSGSDAVGGSAVDMDGNIYISGSTASTSGIITSGAHQTTFGGSSSDAFLVKFNSAGVRQWATYYGGSGIENGIGIATDNAGNIYLAGYTQSTTGISSSGTHQDTYGGGQDAYLVKFNSAGVRQWATYYGGTGSDEATGLAVDASGNVYMSGITQSSTGISTAGAHQAAYGGGADAYIVQFNSAGVRQWATYYGGSGMEIGYSVTASSSGQIYLIGITQSGSAITTSGAHQTVFGGDTDAFLVQFNNSGVRQWGTYYGGSGYEACRDVATDASGNVYLAGSSTSTTSIGTTGAHQETFGGTNDAYLVKFNNAGVRQWGTYYGGASSDGSISVATDATGNAFLTGNTSSTGGISTSGAPQTTLAGGTDGYLVKFNSSGVRQWGTYFGGTSTENVASVVVSSSGNPYISGYTNSTSGIATSGAHQTAYAGSDDGFLVKYSADVAPIGGTLLVFVGETTTLSNTATGGSWTSSNTAVATIGSSTGIVSGVSTGTSLISYTLSGSSVTAVVTVYPLNTLNAAGLSATSTATVAYSLRRLSSSYSGSLIQVRRSSDNTTTNIGYDGSGNLDVAALISFASGGDVFISTWYDQSGHANHAVQSTTSSQPKIVSAGTVITTNSKPAVSFDGFTFLDGGTVGYGISGARTLSAAYRLESGTPFHVLDRNISGTGNPIFSILASNRGQVRNDAASILDGIGSTQSPPFTSFFTMLWSAANNVSIYKNGASNYTGSLALPSTMDIMRIGRHYNAPSACSLNFWEVILFPSALTNTEREAMECNQLSYYNMLTVAAITGTGTINQGDSTTLANAVSGGVWTSSNTSIATVGSTTGIVTGISSGTATISYTVSSGACSVYATTVVTVNSLNTLDLVGLSSSSKAKVAYSLRRLSTTYTGHLIQVRRSSDNATSNIGYDGSGNLDVAALTSFVGSGDGFISIWYDQSGLSNHAVQTTAANQPKIVSSGTVLTSNSKPVISFNGSTFIDGGTTAYGFSGARTLSAVYNLQSGGAGSIIDRNVAGAPLFGIITDNRGIFRDNTGAGFAIGGTAQSPPFSTAFTAMWNSTNSIGVFKNGVSNYTGTIALPSTMDIMRFGKGLTTTAATVLNFWEVILFPSAITTADRQAMECNQLSQYNLLTISAIAGNTALTPGNTSTLTNSGSVGVWTSSNTAVATIGSSSGIVTALTAGSTNITYSVSSGVCSLTATTNVTVASPGLNFDGSNDYISVSGNTIPLANSNYTIEAWIKPVGSGPRGIAGWGNYGVTNQVNALRMGSDTTLINYWWANDLIVTVPNMADGNWHHVAATFDGTTRKIYTDGVLRGQDNPTGHNVPSASNASIGRTFVSEYYSGNMDEVRIWNVARTATQISDAMGCDVATDTNLKAYYRFNQGTAYGTNTGSTGTYDYSGNNNCGTFNNFELTGNSSNYVAGKVGYCNDITPGGVISGVASICQGSTSTLAQSVGGGTWSSSDPAVATINSTTGEISGISPGTAMISYSLPASCAVSPSTIVVTINASPADLDAIVGYNSLTVGTPAFLSHMTAGGVWSSSNTSVATVSTTSGLVTGVSNGTSIISYTVSIGSCSKTTTVMVNVASTGLNFDGTDDIVTIGNNTSVQITNGTIEAWIRTVGAGSEYRGIIVKQFAYGLFLKNDELMTFDWSTSSDISTGVLLNDDHWHHVAMTFNSGVTNGSNIYIDGASVLNFTYNVYSQSEPLVLGNGSASTSLVQNFSGTMDEARVWNVVRSGSEIAADMHCDIAANANLKAYHRFDDGVAYWGNTTITGLYDYSGNGNCGTLNNFDLYPGPMSNFLGGVVGFCNAITPGGTISGTTVICQGTTSAFSSTVPGGTWSSSNTAVGTVNATTGLVTGLGSGTTIISYSLPGICNAAPVTAVMTINPAPDAGTITGTTEIDALTTTTLSSTTTGGMWSSSNTDIATVGSASGIVSGLSDGTTTISYIVTNGCGNDTATAIVTVNGILETEITGTLTLCSGSSVTLANATSGGTWSSGATSIATVDASGNVMGIASGTATISYTFTGISVTAVVTVNAGPSVISGSLAICTGNTTTLTSTPSGGTWTSGNTSRATVDASSGIVTGISAGAVDITYTLASGCRRKVTVTVGTTPATFTGSLSVCLGNTSTLSSATTGGSWSSSNTTKATINATTGVLTPVSAGTATISYTLSAGCFATATVTINSNPGSISGPTSVCEGATVSLGCSPGGGSWSSSGTDAAIFGTAGSVTGVTAGTNTITYTLANGCFSTRDMTVKPLPTAITGSLITCTGQTTALSTTPGGGVWTSSNTSKATINSSTGVATGVSAGTTTIIYGLAGCTTSAVVTVMATPAAITGTLALCSGSTTALASATTGGNWSSTNTSIATANVATGIISGVSTGTTTIIYALGSCSVSAIATVNAALTANTGNALICVGLGSILSNTTTGGTWSSSNVAIATVSASTGAVTGISAGTANITYRKTPGCFSITEVTVNTAVAAITGSLSVCPGSATTLVNTTSGGAWSSNNTTIATIDAGTGVATGASTGSAIISYVVSSGCYRTATLTVNSLPGTIAGTASMCTGSGTTLSCSPGGGTWSSTATSVATVGTAGFVYGVAPGTAIISYTQASGCASTREVTVTAATSAISGTLSLCSGTSTTLTATPSGGTWSLSSSTLGTINATSGLLTATGTTAGTSVVTYTVGGCRSTAVFTVAPSPSAITGTLTMCAGNYGYLSATPSGGVWSSSDTTIAYFSTIYPTLTSVSAGIVTITYSFGACSSTNTVTVNAAVPAISGPSGVCVGQTIALTNSSAGGTWSATNSRATVGATTGLVTGVSSGGVAIRYITGPSCISTKIVTVSAAISPHISGVLSTCVGGTRTLAHPTAGGVWSSSSANVSVHPSTGLVTGISGGTATITYTVGSCSAFATFYVISADISGVSSICAGYYADFYGSPYGGTWSASLSYPGVATVYAYGRVRGISSGLVSLTYTSPTGCRTSRLITINNIPFITGASAVCVGATTALSSSASGGTWFSYNTARATVNASTGVVTGVSYGYVYIGYTSPAGCTAVYSMYVEPGAPPISSLDRVAVGCSIYAYHSSYSGTWTSSNPARATVVSAGHTSGYVTGVSTGAATITYVTASGCTVTKNIIVDPALPSITGLPIVCVGQTNSTLSHPMYGGTWSSDNTAVASINASTGLLSGISTGVANIRYTVGGTGSYAVMSVTVNPAVASITGVTPLCPGTTTTLANATPGGTWLSSNTARATVDISTGLATGISGGTVTISYRINPACFSTTTITINNLPNVSGASTVVNGASTTFGGSPGGGTWSSASPAIASVSGTGVVTGNSVAATTITYTLGTGCFRTKAITVLTSKPGETEGATLENGGVLKVYPNPTSGQLTIEAPQNGIFSIFTIDGKQVAQYTVTTTAATVSLPKELAAGIYMCRFAGADGSTAIVRLVFEP
ncbi:MAG: Ig-like domain-containing protein [Taibaiella sp.]|nr:Ig-like domain-containing protein [Taibaiella sp.]